MGSSATPTGGLFALYAWLQATSPFATFGAGSPGVAATDSQVFPLIAALSDHDPASSARRLHVTLNEAELFGEIPIYREIGRNLLTVLEELHARGRAADVSRAMLHETHLTGLQSSVPELSQDLPQRARGRSTATMPVSESALLADLSAALPADRLTTDPMCSRATRTMTPSGRSGRCPPASCDRAPPRGGAGGGPGMPAP